MASDKLVVILGPTSSGKSSLGIKLAKKFNGEVISADSRQVYKGMDIGSGKITKTEQRMVKHHLLDVALPKQQYTVAKFSKQAAKAVRQIQAQAKLPFIVGGTAFYIYSVIDGLDIPVVKPDLKLRKKLSTKSADQLFKMLQKLDPKRALTIDRKNKVRLIRAIEINKKIGKVPELKFPNFQNHDKSKLLILGVKRDLNKLRKLINARVDQRLKQGMVAEVKKLKANGISFKRLESFGLDYRQAALFLQNKISFQEMVQAIKNENWHFAKRQLTWFKRDPRIEWV
ncbi:MAG: tRNA (adenosine(37)-N6)-dimethylallyltransferase MiaA, partial [Acidobacteriaceae bacterium]